MKILKNLTKKALIGGAAAVSVALLPAISQAGGATGPVEGVWNYTGLTTSSGTEMPLTGIFVMSDGKFLQQSIFNGEPFEHQAAMAHSGTYEKTEKGVDLEAGQTIKVAPAEKPPLTDVGITQHELKVTREGDNITLVFGSGTVQTLEKVGEASDAEIYTLEKGMLAFADGYFALVNGDGKSAVTGFGKYRQEDGRLLLEVIRWAEAAEGLGQNFRDVTFTARFDGEKLVLADGRTYPVKD